MHAMSTLQHMVLKAILPPRSRKKQNKRLSNKLVINVNVHARIVITTIKVVVRIVTADVAADAQNRSRPPQRIPPMNPLVFSSAGFFLLLNQIFVGKHQLLFFVPRLLLPPLFTTVFMSAISFTYKDRILSYCPGHI